MSSTSEHIIKKDAEGRSYVDRDAKINLTM